MLVVAVLGAIAILVLVTGRADPDVRAFEQWQAEHGTPGHRREVGPDNRVYLVRDRQEVSVLAECFQRVRLVVEECSRQWGPADLRARNLLRLLRNPRVSTLAQDLSPSADQVLAFTFWTNPGLEPWVCVRTSHVNADALMETVLHEMAHVALGYRDLPTEEEYHAAAWQSLSAELRSIAYSIGAAARLDARPCDLQAHCVT